MPRLEITGLTDVQVLKNNAGVIESVDLDFANTADFQPNEKEITFLGDNQEKKVPITTGLSVEIEGDVVDVTAIDDIYDITPVVAPISGGANRRYFGNNTQMSVRCGLSATAICTNKDTNLTEYWKVVAPVGTMNGAPPLTLKTHDKAPLKWKFAAEKTTVDIAGAPLTDVPTDGCFWYLEDVTTP